MYGMRIQNLITLQWKVAHLFLVHGSRTATAMQRGHLRDCGSVVVFSGFESIKFQLLGRCGIMGQR